MGVKKGKAKECVSVMKNCALLLKAKHEVIVYKAYKAH